MRIEVPRPGNREQGSWGEVKGWHRRDRRNRDGQKLKSIGPTSPHSENSIGLARNLEDRNMDVCNGGDIQKGGM